MSFPDVITLKSTSPVANRHFAKNEFMSKIVHSLTLGYVVKNNYTSFDGLRKISKRSFPESYQAAHH